MSISLDELRNHDGDDENKTVPSVVIPKENPNAIKPVTTQREELKPEELEDPNAVIAPSYLDVKKSQIADILAEKENEAAEYFAQKQKEAADVEDAKDTESLINDSTPDLEVEDEPVRGNRPSNYNQRNRGKKPVYKNPIALPVNDNEEKTSDDDISKYLSEEIEDVVSEADGDRLKKEMKDVFRKIGYSQNSGEVLDLTEFTIVDKPKSIYDSINSMADMDTSVAADWYLPNSGFGMTMDRMKAVEIELLNPRSSMQNNNATNLKMFKAIYKHCVMANKPKFEDWMRAIKATDENSLFYLTYISSFPGDNPILRQCTDEKCLHEFAEASQSEDIPVFKTTQAKDAFFKKLEEYDGTWSDAATMEYKIKQVSSKYAIKIKQPSLFETQIELFYGNEKFKEDYNDTIQYIIFLEDVYEIDKASKKLIPLDYKKYEKDDKATYISKVKAYSEFVRSLDTQGLSVLDKIIGDDSEEVVTYKYLDTKCPKCGKTIIGEEMSMRSTVFYRHRMEATINS
jgi:SOS-response transcriptional repressor LexA